MSNKWVQLCGDKKQNVKRIAEQIEDLDKIQLGKFSENKNLASHDDKVVNMFKKRKLIQQTTLKSYKVTKGVNFAP